MQFYNGNLWWNIFFIRPVQDWEIDLVIPFFDLLYSLKSRQGDEDKMLDPTPEAEV